MKKARLVTIGVAATAFLGALYMFSSQKPPPPPAVVQAIPAAPPPMATDEVLVAAHEMGMGTLLAAPDLAWAVWPSATIGNGMIRKSETPNIVEDVKGAVTRGAFFQGEPIRREKIVKGPNSGFMSAILASGKRAMAINIDASGSTTAGGFILPNDHVDILRTRKDDEGKGDGYVTEVLLSNMRVLAIGQNVQEKNGERVVVGSNATLEVDPRQAEILTQAQRVSQLSMTLRSMLDAQKVDEVDNSPRQDAGLTIIRFGVAAPLSKQ